MPFEIRTDAGEMRLTLSGRLGVQQARPLWDALQPGMADATSLRVETDLVDEMDTSIAQILYRLHGLGLRVRFGSPSDGFLGSLKSRGLERFFFEAASSAGEAKPPDGIVAGSTRTPSRRKERASDGKKNSRGR